jgi:hypothetical protein
MLIGGIVDTLVASQVNAINGQSCSHSHASIVARLECWDGGFPSGFQSQYNSIRQTEAHQSAIIFERVSAPVISGRKMSSVCNCAIRVLYSAGWQAFSKFPSIQSLSGRLILHFFRYCSPLLPLPLLLFSRYRLPEASSYIAAL